MGFDNRPDPHPLDLFKPLRGETHPRSATAVRAELLAFYLSCILVSRGYSSYDQLSSDLLA
jgi:hypothetical protein